MSQPDVPVTYTEAIWRSLYRRHRVENGVRVAPLYFGRAYAEQSWNPNLPGMETYQRRRDWLTGHGLDNQAAVLVVGSAFGFLVEYLLDAGIDTWGIDPSPWIWDPAQDGEWRADVKARTANDWVGSGTEQASLQAIGAPVKYRFVLDEDCAPSHSDAELPAYIAGCEARLQGNVKGRIVHIVSVLDPLYGPGDSSQNWKTLADWELIAPDHTWVDSRVAAGVL